MGGYQVQDEAYILRNSRNQVDCKKVAAVSVESTCTYDEHQVQSQELVLKPEFLEDLRLAPALCHRGPI